MRIGLLSDTHDRVPAIRELLQQMVAGGVSLVMHAGDYCSPFSLQPFHDLSLPLLGVFGRNDGDRDALIATAKTGFGAA
jgi:putative phosphoesterase